MFLGSRLLTVALFLLFWTSNLFAQSCDALLAHGINNVRIATSSVGSIVTNYFNHCEDNRSSWSDETLARASVEVLGYGSGDGSFSRARTQEELSQWCETNEDLAKSNSDIREETRQIYAGAVEAWTRCNELAERGIRVDADILPNNRVIDIGLWRAGPGDGVEYLGVTADQFTCTERTPTGNAGSQDQPIAITGNAINISCHRDDPVMRTRDSGDYEVLEWGRVTVHTAGGPFQFYFEQQERPTLPTAAAIRLRADLEALSQEHTALQSALNRAVIAFAQDQCPDGWEEYAPAYGRVVRGIDRSGAGVDSEGERPFGHLQEDAIQHHLHTSTFHSSGTTGNRPHANMEYPHPQGNAVIPTTGIDGARVRDEETTVRNVALLYCRPS